MTIANAPIDVSGSLVKVAVPGGTPTFTIVADLTGYSSTRTKGNSTTKVRVMNKVDPYVKTSNDPTTTYALSGLLNLGDTAGQNIIRAAYFADSDLLLQVLPDGVNGEQNTVKITDYSDAQSADGQFVTVSFTATATGSRTVLP